MRSNHSFAINFIKRKSSGDKALLYARITLNGERVEISLKEQVNSEEWDGRREQLKGKGVHSKQVNKFIEDVRFRIKEKYQLLLEELEELTADKIKQAYLENHFPQQGHSLLELIGYFKMIWEPKLKPGGFKNYKTTFQYLELFLRSKYPDGDISLSKITGEFATELEYYIRTRPVKDHDPCKGNGVGKHLQRFKRLMNWAADDIKWVKENQCRKYSCPLRKTKIKKLDMGELVALETKVFADHSLDYIRELFIYSCYTGLAYAEAMKLSDNEIHWDTSGIVWCQIYRTKTDELCTVPLLRNATMILKKYREDAIQHGRNNIFPPVSNKYVNECLKIIQAACDIKTYLTFHVARHTFAKTVALKNGIPLETVQMMMGHTKISTTQIYADVDEEKILVDMQGLDEKIDLKKALILERNIVTS